MSSSLRRAAQPGLSGKTASVVHTLVVWTCQSFLEDLTKSYVSETFFSISLLICLTPDESLVRAALMLLIGILLNAEVVL